MLNWVRFYKTTNTLLINCGRLVNKKGPGLELSHPNHVKYFLKIVSMTISVNCSDFMINDSKYLKMYSTSCANNHDITTFKVDVMV